MKNIILQTPAEYSIGNKDKYNYVDQKDLKNRKVLDIGCGYGWFEYLALKDGVASITGTEITESDLSTARKYIKNKKAKFDVASAIELPYKSNTFDTVVSWEVLEHIPKGTEDEMFKEIFRVLKPGGVFYFSTPHDNLLAKFLDPAWVVYLGGHRHYSCTRIVGYATSNGFYVADYIVKGGMVTILNDLNMYVSKWFFRRPPLFKSLFDKWTRSDLESKNNKLSNLYCKLMVPKDE